MVLPDARIQDANDVLTIADVLPDVSWVQYKYNVAPLHSVGTFTRTLRENGFTQSSPTKPLGRWFDDQLLFPRPVYVTAQLIAASRTACFTAQFSPLTDFRNEELDYDNEYSRPYHGRRPGASLPENWLHSDQINETTRRTVLFNLWSRVRLIEDQIYPIACRLISIGPFTDFASVVAMKLCVAELCVDLRTPSPHYHLRRLAPRFRARYDRVAVTRYGPSARGHAELANDMNLIRGYHAKNQMMKAYEKTNSRIRLEFAAKGTGLKPLLQLTAQEKRERSRLTGCPCPSDPREFHVEEDFYFLFDRLTAAVLPHFNAIRGDEPEPSDNGSIFEFVSRSASVLSRHNAAQLERAYRVLALEGRLTPRTLSLPALLRLTQAGVLRRSMPGIYIPDTRFQRALRTLRTADGRWQGDMRREHDL
jgi:hypothetical protein